jgi:hypothetical protein
MRGHPLATRQIDIRQKSLVALNEAAFEQRRGKTHWTITVA